MTLLKLTEIHKHYTLGENIIKANNGIDFEVEEGEFISIMGPSGSGKSTLMHLASLLENPTSGKIILKGKDVTNFNEVELAKIRNEEVGFIFQQFNLLSKVPAWENVALPLVYRGESTKKRYKKAKEMMEIVGLGDRLNNSRGQLSGGQQQRVAVARALVNDPSIVFADEPTGNLDSVSGGQIMNLLVELNNQGRTIVIVTHEREIAEYANRNIYLSDGKITSDKKKRKKKKKSKK
ncbi:ABC transporter ATP-binding protein [Patescibacteria group bacterium]